MALSDITGVFSRYFVVGFFLPAYTSLLALWATATPAFIPNTLERHSQTTQVLILGAVALVAGLALSGLSFYVMRAVEGYPLLRAPFLFDLAVRAERRKFDGLVKIRDDERKPLSERSRAAWCLERFYPHDRVALLPTRIGNTIRAFERHSNVRWGLDGVTIWPRIEPLLSADERELLVDAKTDLYVFINAALGALAVGLCLVIDKALHAPRPIWEWTLYLLPEIGAYALYRVARDPAERWGEAVRSSIDLHRLDLYEKLGVRAPTSFTDEREVLAPKVNAALLYGRHLIPDDLWRAKEASSESEQRADDLHGLLDSVKKLIAKGVWADP